MHVALINFAPSSDGFIHTLPCNRWPQMPALRIAAYQNSSFKFGNCARSVDSQSSTHSRRGARSPPAEFNPGKQNPIGRITNFAES